MRFEIFWIQMSWLLPSLFVRTFFIAATAIASWWVLIVHQQANDWSQKYRWEHWLSEFIGPRLFRRLSTLTHATAQIVVKWKCIWVGKSPAEITFLPDLGTNMPINSNRCSNAVERWIWNFDVLRKLREKISYGMI